MIERSDIKLTALIRNLINNIPTIVIFTLVAVLYLSGSFTFIEQKFQDERFRFVQRDASANTVIVAIDSFSLKELGAWPWPRRLHARLLDSLNAAGANRIAFDLDFSSPSNPIDDSAFENALKRAAGKVVMIAFQQYQTVNGARVFSTNSPIKNFQQYAVTAAANIRSDRDGIIRRQAIYQEIDHKKVLTVPAVLAPSADITSPVFSIDFGIRVNSIPVISYADILLNRVDLRSIKGKNILIGATAIELGDQLAVPVYQSLSSVYVLVEAIESLAQNRAIMHISPFVILFIIALLSFYFGAKFRNLPWRKGFVLLLFSIAFITVSSVLIYAVAPVSIDTIPLVTMLMTSALVGWFWQIDIQSLAAFRSSMALESQDNFTQHIIENAFDGIFVFTANGNIEFFNDAAKKLFGYNAEEISGKNISFVMGEKGKSIEPIDPSHFQPGESETIGIKSDGLTFPIEISISKIESPISKHTLERRRVPRVSYLCTVRDISERKARDADFSGRHTEMTEANRIISMSEMAAGLAHEINQPMTAIFGYLEGVRRRLKNISIVPENIVEAIDKALSQAERTQEIIRRARGATQKIELNRSALDLNTIVEEVVDLLKFDISRYGVSIHLDLAQRLPLVQADAVQIQQVIINLARNGMEAMTELSSMSRYLTIETNVDTEGYVQVNVKDNGPGFAEDIKDKLFFPFATTKKEGMGIGLTICSTIIEDHDGKISIGKEPNGPTVFSVKLPPLSLASSAPVTPALGDDLPQKVNK
tara:strand:- start:8683 stop:10968 length:2286 start_codon:yes stop_codon:yes gene_type:complete